MCGRPGDGQRGTQQGAFFSGVLTDTQHRVNSGDNDGKGHTPHCARRNAARRFFSGVFTNTQHRVNSCDNVAKEAPQTALGCGTKSKKTPALRKNAGHRRASSGEHWETRPAQVECCPDQQPTGPPGQQRRTDGSGLFWPLAARKHSNVHHKRAACPT